MSEGQRGAQADHEEFSSFDRRPGLFEATREEPALRALAGLRAGAPVVLLLTDRAELALSPALARFVGRALIDQAAAAERRAEE